MKTKFILLFLSYTCVSFGQITLNSENYPVVGDQIITVRDTLAVGLSQGEPGENQVYDFTQFIAHQTDTINFLDPDSTIYSDDFPNATVAYLKDSTYGFFTQNSEQAELVGGVGYNRVSEDPIVLNYTNNETIAKFPTSYNDMWNDTSQYDFTIDVSTTFGIDSARNKRDTYKQVHNDGWGNVITSYGNFQCLRQKTYVTVIDTTWLHSLNGGWAILGTDIETDTLFTWSTDYPSAKYPIASTRLDGNGNFTYLEVLRIANDGLSSKGSTRLNNVTIYPNPTHDRVNLSGLKTNTNYDLTLFNSSGQAVYTENLINTNNKTLDLSNFDKGIYFLSVTNEDGSSSVKQTLIIQ